MSIVENIISIVENIISIVENSISRMWSNQECEWSEILFPYLIISTVMGRAFYFSEKGVIPNNTVYELLSSSREVGLFPYFRPTLLLQCYMSFGRKIYQHCYDAESNIYALEVYITSNIKLLVLARLLAVVVVSSQAMQPKPSGMDWPRLLDVIL